MSPFAKCDSVSRSGGKASGLSGASVSGLDRNDLTMRPITGREELDLFGRLSYVLNGELADDLAAGRRRPEWMWVALPAIASSLGPHGGDRAGQ